jgi:hypothetical protein
MNLHLPTAALLIADVVKVFNPQPPQARAIFNLGIVTAIVAAVTGHPRCVQLTENGIPRRNLPKGAWLVINSSVS